MCNQTVTLIHHVKEKDGDSYTCKAYGCASWFEKRGISTSGDGAAPSNTYEVRIMTQDDVSPSVGDYVVLGTVENVATPSDLAKHDHFRVTAVGDNRRGKLAHWRLSGQ